MQKVAALDAELKNPNSDLRPLAELFKRIANITKDVTDLPTVDRGALKEDAEIALHDSFNAVSAQADAAARIGGRFSDAIRLYVTLRQPVDRFFTDVMVMVDDAALRNARLALLARVRHAIISNIGDLTQLGANT